MLIVGQTFLRDRTDINTFWTLVGTAVRIGERLGIQLEESLREMTPFDNELRRRLWWSILKLDDLAAQKSGGKSVCSRSDWDTKLPSNVEDQDLRPDMIWTSAVKATPNVFMHGLVQFEILNFHYNMKRHDGYKVGDYWFRNDGVAIEEKERAIESLEQMLQNKYLRHIDHLNPVHFLTWGMTKSISNNTLLAAHYQQSKTAKQVSQSKKDLMFALAQKSLEYNLLCMTTDLVKGFRWHTENYFPWM